ncbi:hypothetical protein HPB49_008773 [Dermacentor silvarum]|uniref:Uncharacterized protein n=1 Tax=Dermacentor silvarum TaxID=543639 RepID=A0ACB8DXY7_DERSI|nr:hypothetical protein HPB49_008773 [Dermacentor silvarum]
MQLGNFVASSHYINRWKQRFGIAMRRATNESQKTPEEFSEAASAFRSSANSLRRRYGYTLYNMANMDQTIVRIDNPANRTNNVIGESTIRIANTGCARRGFTVCLAACATGHKLPVFIIFKEQSGEIPARAFASLRIPVNVRLTATKNGWMTSEKMQEWLSIVWGPNVDDAPIHKTQAAKNAFEEYDTDVLYVPAGSTSIHQPADVYCNKPFKSTLRRLWEQYMREEERTPKGNLKKPSRHQVLDFVAEAWAAVPDDTVARSFKGCGISNALDGSEDGDLHSGLADVGAVVPEDRGGLQAECCDLFFATDSEEFLMDCATSLRVPLARHRLQSPQRAHCWGPRDGGERIPRTWTWAAEFLLVALLRSANVEQVPSAGPSFNLLFRRPRVPSAEASQRESDSWCPVREAVTQGQREKKARSSFARGERRSARGKASRRRHARLCSSACI